MMYPLTDNPTYKDEFESFEELKDLVEGLDEELNFIVSWLIGCRTCDMVKGEKGWELGWEAGEKNFFSLLIFMPRKSQTTQLTVEFEGEVDHAQVDNWLSEYVMPRTLRWYGWEHLDK